MNYRLIDKLQDKYTNRKYKKLFKKKLQPIGVSTGEYWTTTATATPNITTIRIPHSEGQTALHLYVGFEREEDIDRLVFHLMSTGDNSLIKIEGFMPLLAINPSCCSKSDKIWIDMNWLTPEGLPAGPTCTELTKVDISSTDDHPLTVHLRVNYSQVKLKPKLLLHQCRQMWRRYNNGNDYLLVSMKTFVPYLIFHSDTFEDCIDKIELKVGSYYLGIEAPQKININNKFIFIVQFNNQSGDKPSRFIPCIGRDNMRNLDAKIYFRDITEVHNICITTFALNFIIHWKDYPAILAMSA